MPSEEEIRHAREILLAAERAAKSNKKEVDADFELKSVSKFISDRPSYEVALLHGGTITKLTVPHTTWYEYRLFRKYFHSVTDTYLARIDQHKWEAITSAIRPIGIDTAPETSINGMILETVQTLIENAQRMESTSLAMAKVFALYDDEGQFYLTTRAVTAELPRGVPVSRQTIGATLAAAGWRSKQIKQPDGSKPRFWIRATDNRETSDLSPPLPQPPVPPADHDEPMF